MNLQLVRFANFEDRTIGQLRTEGRTWYTVENPWVGNTSFISCIPDGSYTLRRFFDVHNYRSSKRIDQEYVWEICDVPGRTVILFHVANWPHEVDGCLGLGTGLYADLAGVSSSRKAVKSFYSVTEGYEELSLTLWKGAI